MIVSPYYVLLSIENRALCSGTLAWSRTKHGTADSPDALQLPSGPQLHLGSVALIVQRFCNRLHQPPAGAPLTVLWIQQSD
jgi:hypothetical protein